MQYLSNINQLNILLKSELETLSGLNGQLVRSTESEYGTDLDVNEEDSIFYGTKPSDLLILFELSPLDNIKDMSEKNTSSNNINYYKMFTMRVILYGEQSMDKSMQLIARFRSEETRDDLISKGVHIENLSEMTKISEFINGVYWIRTDFEITLGATFLITPIKTAYEYQGYSQTNIYTK